MKKFITTKLHAVVSVQEQTVENEKVIKEEEEEEEEENVKKLIGGGIVGLQSAATAATSSLSSPLSSAVAVTVMTLNSPTSKQQQQQQHNTGSSKSNSKNNNGMMTGEVPPGASSQLVQQHGIITISKPKPPATVAKQISSGGSSGSTTAAQVKMCGYLKKKRNKMGGWRKMYFILQNQLLLSYSSKDDYEKKLAPFKDIINLVPGTVIIPTTGPRFTIETNSKVLYTFRCDDHKSCSEWITALLDSLKGDGSGDKKFSHHALHGGSSNLHHHLTRRSLSSLSSSSSSTSSSASCYATDDPSKMAITSIRRLQQTNLLHPQQKQQQQHQQQQKQTSLSAPNLFYGFGSNGGATASAILATSNSSHVKMGKLVQLPIAGGTARLLERGGPNGQKMYKILTINEDEDDGENDEKPIATTATTTARGISNGNASRGDTGIKAATAAASAAPTSTATAASTEEKGKNAIPVKSRSATTTALTANGEKPTKHAAGKGGQADELFNSNFRLHTNLRKVHQSIEVCRINSMFGGKKLASSSSGKRLNNHGVDSKSASSDCNSSNLAASTGDLRSSKIVGGNNNNNNNNVIHNNLRGTRGGSATDLRRKPPPDLLLHSTGPGTMMEPKPLKDINHNHLAKWSAESITIELTANGYNLTGTGIKSVGSTDTLFRKPNATGGEFIVPRSRSRSNSHSSNLQQSSSALSPSSSQQPQHHGFTSKIDLMRTLSSASARREGQRSSVPSKRNDYEEIDAGDMVGRASPMMEPIYAVVDLNVKKARRLNQLKEHDSLGTDDDGAGTEEEHSIKVDMVRDKETGRLKEKPRSANVLSLGGVFGGGTNDYEELNELVMESFVNFGEDSNDGENIYEPINIPEGPLTSSSTSLPSSQPTASSSQMNNLWRNLKKMNINHLIKRSAQDPQPNQRPDEDLTTKASTFTEFSRRFGHHRRSIKNKMRGLYDRGQPSPVATAEAPAKITQSDEKLRKSTFGRNKKSRKSLSFDDFIPRKKHHHHLNGVGVIYKSDKANEKLHKELKRQLSKRSNSSSGGSSFNDSKNGIEL